MIMRIIFLLFCGLGFFVTPSSAQLYLENAKVVLSVSPGEHTNSTLRLRNNSSEPVDVKVYWEDFAYKAPYDGAKNFSPAGTLPGSASSWVTFSPQEFTIPGNGQQIIDYTVTVPDDIKGGHYGVLFFETNLGPATNRGEAVNIITRVGCLFFIEARPRNKKAALEDITLKDNTVSAQFANQGDVVLIPRTTYYIMQEGGMVQDRGEAKKLYVPPGAMASLKIPLNNNLKQGRYALVINADLDEGDVVVKEISFVKDASDQITIESIKD